MTIRSKNYSIMVAAFPFVCLSCDGRVRKGENYIRLGNAYLCLSCGLPERRLRPVMQKEIVIK